MTCIVRALDNGVAGYNRKPSYRGVFRAVPNARQLSLIKNTANLDISIIRIEVG